MVFYDPERFLGCCIIFNLICVFWDSDCVCIQFVSYKHSKGKTAKIDIPVSNTKYCPRYLLSKYLKIRGSKSGYLYCTICNKPLSYAFVYKNVKLSVKVLNINGVLTPHSFRIGAATWAYKQGTSIDDIMRMGRWSSNSVQNYIRVPCVKLCSIK